MRCRGAAEPSGCHHLAAVEENFAISAGSTVELLLVEKRRGLHAQTLSRARPGSMDERSIEREAADRQCEKLWNAVE